MRTLLLEVMVSDTIRWLLHIGEIKADRAAQLADECPPTLSGTRPGCLTASPSLRGDVSISGEFQATEASG